MKKKEKSGEFEFTGEMSAAAVTGLEFRDSFSPSESLDGMLERMEESTEQILVVLGKDTATGDFSSTCFISGSRKTVNKVFEKKERIDEKEDTQISSFIDTNHHKVVCEEEENSLYYRKNISWMLIISISALMLLYFIYKKRRILF